MDDGMTVGVLRESLSGLDAGMPVKVVHQGLPDIAPLPVRDLTDYRYPGGEAELILNVG